MKKFDFYKIAIAQIYSITVINMIFNIELLNKSFHFSIKVQLSCIIREGMSMSENEFIRRVQQMYNVETLDNNIVLGMSKNNRFQPGGNCKVLSIIMPRKSFS